MMIDKKMADRLNEQVNNELYNAMSYLSMAYWFEAQGLKVFAKFFFKQSDEEREHSAKIAQYLLDQGGEVKITTIKGPETDFKSAKDAVKSFLHHEEVTTKQVHEITKLAYDLEDYATREFIDWKVAEQVEEVASASELLQMVNMTDNPGQLLMLENRLWHMIQNSDD